MESKPKSQDLSCQKFRQMASEYLEGTLGPRVSWKFNYHGERCKGCGAFAATLQATISVLRSLPSLEAPEELKRRIREEYLRGSSDVGPGV
ncbi:MAG: hypothetical protein HW388_390 [Dehalococcoidia bacterium]|nr:hypothetical protein [Dehalococcoidia bacterium]